MPPDRLTLLLVLVLLAGLGWELWLLRRQARHVLTHRDRVPPAFEGRIGLAQHRKAADYTADRARVAAVSATLSTLLLLGWSVGGGLDALNGMLVGAGIDGIAGGVALLLAVLAIGGLVRLPVTAWRTFGVEARHGFNRTTPGLFFADLLRTALLVAVLAAPVFAAILWLESAGGGLWWLWAWATWMGFTLLVGWAFPRFIAPLFNRFRPLADPELRRRIERLLQRCGFSSRGVYVMDGSRRSSHGNAYFTGLGRNKRIVFFDTLLEHLDADQVEAVLAHELGHFHHRHILKRLLLSGLIGLAAFALFAWLLDRPAVLAGLGLDHPGPATGIILLGMLAPAVTFPLEPVGNWLSRRDEFQADDYAVAHADGQQLIAALLALYRENAATLTPDPLYSAVHHSHPPAAVRIDHISSSLGN